MAAPASGADIELPIADKRKPIEVQADAARQWRKGAYQVWLLSGNVSIRQGAAVTHSNEAVLWVEQRERYSAHPSMVIAYLEGGVRVDFGHAGAPHRVSGQAAQSLQDDSWFGRFYTIDTIQIKAPIVGGEPNVLPAVFEQGMKARDPNVVPAQFAGAMPGASARNLSVLPRDSVGIELDVRNSAGEAVAIISSGVRVIIDDVEIRSGAAQSTALGKIEIETDRLVAWTANIRDLVAAIGGQTALQSKATPLEFYLEGNIVFRQGDSVIYAERMYYNAAQEYGVVLDAEMLAAAPQYGGLIRLKAQLLQATGRRSFAAYNAAVTTSRMGEPKYWLQFGELSIRDEPTPALDPAGRPLFDQVTGEQSTEHNYRATARNTAAYVGGFPIFFWPVFSSDFSQSTFYLENIKFQNDSVFGAQVYTDWNMYSLLGLQNPPEGTNWQFSADYLSERGPALGTNFKYDRDRGLFLEGPTKGEFDAWGIKDTGLDNLGRDRRALTPEKEYRGRMLWRHRQYLPSDWVVTAELGWISDRNFLEQYFEYEWDTFDDQNTSLEIKKYFRNQSLSVLGSVRLNDFFTQTEWWPRLDHYFFGQDVGPFSWGGHSNVGYARLRTATAPLDPVDAAKFDPLPWEVEREGLRAITRQELEFPVQAGPVKLSAFVGGEIGYWEQDVNAMEITRLTGQTGVRAACRSPRSIQACAASCST